MKRFFLFALACAMLTSCNDFGKKVQVNAKNEVYYKGDGVTEAQAQKLGKFFTDQGYFDNTKESTVQVLKDGDAYLVRMVVDKQQVDKDKDFYTRYFWYIQNTISKDVFDGQKTRIALADDQLKELERVGDIARASINPVNSIYYNPADEKEATAKQLGEYLTRLGYFNGTKELDVFLYKEKGAHTVRFMIDEKAFAQNKDAAMPFFQIAKYAIEKNVFKSEPTRVWLTSLELKDVQEVQDLSAEDKTTVDAELSKL